MNRPKDIVGPIVFPPRFKSPANHAKQLSMRLSLLNQNPSGRQKIKGAVRSQNGAILILKIGNNSSGWQ